MRLLERGLDLGDLVPLAVVRKATTRRERKRAFDHGVSFGLRMAADRVPQAMSTQLEALADEWPTLGQVDESLATVHRLRV